MPRRVGYAEDLKRGLVDRLRSLPMTHSAVFTGCTICLGILVFVPLSVSLYRRVASR